jgi:hypothetical protein
VGIAADLSLGPLSILFVVLALVLSVACVVLAGRRARRIEQMSVPQLRELTRELRKLPVEERAGELLRRAGEGTWEHRLAQEMLEAKGGPARVAAANDVLFDVEHEIDVGKTWSTAAVRIALAGTCLLGLTAYLVRGGPMALAGALLIGFAGAGVSFFAGERGKERATAIREAFDALVMALLPEEVAASRAQRARRKGRA